MGTGDLSITAFLEEIGTRLTDIAARAPRWTAPNSGRRTRSCALAVDTDEVIYEVKILYSAVRLAGRRQWDRVTRDD